MAKSGINRILIIRLSSMGDLILTTALVRQLRNAYPEAEIDFLLDKRFGEIYKYNPRITNLIEIDKKRAFKELVAQNRALCSIYAAEGKYDIVIDLQKSIKSRILRRGLGRKCFQINKNRLHKLSLVHLKKPLNREIIPVPELYRSAAGSLLDNDDQKGLELWLPDEKPEGIYPPEYRKQPEEFIIAVAPGAKHATKRWIPDKFVQLIRKLYQVYQCGIVLIGGDDTIEVGEFINNEAGVPVNNLTGNHTIIDTAEVLDKCSLLITNDTGVMHVAAARQVPTVAVFGSTVPEFGFAPFKVPHRIVQVELGCRPCTHIGRQSCPLGHFNCMNLIETEDVFNASAGLLNINKP